MFIFLFLICFSIGRASFVADPLLTINTTTWLNSDFYEDVFKEDWDGLSLEKKVEALEDFISRELVIKKAEKIGLHNDPKIKKDLLIRKKALLINNTYEHLIARPLILQEDFETNIKNLKYKAEIYHLVVGFSESQEDTGSLISQKEAFSLTDSLYREINKEIALNQEKASSVFSRFATDFSDDPSAKKNGGFLGWVPWGQTVMSFQKPVFELKNNVVSKPILTPYGYHLALKTKQDVSNYFYYTPKHYTDLSYKVSQAFLDFDSLKTISADFDSLLIKQGALSFNATFIDSLVLFIDKKREVQKMLGNKNTLIAWLKEFTKQDVFFLFKNKGFGLSWLIEQLQNIPSSRVPPLKSKQEIKNLVVSFLLQEEVFLLSQTNNIDATVSFKRDWLNNYKNILYSEYITFLNSSFKKTDSSLVAKKYEEGIYKNKYIKPKRAVFTEVRVFNDSLGFVLKEKQQKGVLFDSLVVEYGGAIREPVSSGAQSPLGKALFTMSPGETSPIIKNSDGSFSIARLESFLPAEPFSLDRVFSQIALEIKKEKQDSVRINLFRDLKKEFLPIINYKSVGLN